MKDMKVKGMSFPQGFSGNPCKKKFKTEQISKENNRNREKRRSYSEVL